jgi:hypothetical protein
MTKHAWWMSGFLAVGMAIGQGAMADKPAKPKADAPKAIGG